MTDADDKLKEEEDEDEEDNLFVCLNWQNVILIKKNNFLDPESDAKGCC